MEDSDFKQKIMYMLGKIEATQNEIQEHLKKLNGDLARTKKDVSRHNVLLGKIGVGIGIFVFALTTVVNCFISFFKDRFN